MRHVADTGNNRIYHLGFVGGLPTWAFSSHWGTFGTGQSQFDHPTDVAAAADGTVYVVDSGNHRIQMFTSEGIYAGEWGSMGSGPGEFQNPTYICVADSVYVADTGNHRIQKFSQDGVFQRAWGTEGSDSGEFMDIAGLVVVPEEDAVYVVDHVLNRIQTFDTNGNFQSVWSMLGDLSLRAPAGLSADHMGRLLVADLGNERIVMWEPGGDACSWPSAFPVRRPYGLRRGASPWPRIPAGALPDAPLDC